MTEHSSGQNLAKDSGDFNATLWHWIIGVAGAVLFVVLLRRISWSDVCQMLRMASLPMMIAGLGMRFLATLIRAVRFNYFFRMSANTSYSFGIFCLLRLVNYLMPFRTGEIASMGMLKKAGLSPAVMESASVWIVLKAIDIVTAGTVIMPMVVPVAGHRLVSDVKLSAWAVSSCVCGLVLFCLMLVALKVLERRWVVLPGAGWRNHMNRFVGGIRYLSFWKVTAAFMLGISIAAVNILSCSVVLLGFNPSMPIQIAVSAPAIALLLSLMPITPPLGIGATDAVWVGSLMLLGVPQETALALAIGMRMHQMVSIGIEGGIGLSAIGLRRSAVH